MRIIHDNVWIEAIMKVFESVENRFMKSIIFLSNPKLTASVVLIHSKKLIFWKYCRTSSHDRLHICAKDSYILCRFIWTNFWNFSTKKSILHLIVKVSMLMTSKLCLHLYERRLDTCLHIQQLFFKRIENFVAESEIRLLLHTNDSEKREKFISS